MFRFGRVAMSRPPRIRSRIQRHRAFTSIPDKVPKLEPGAKQACGGHPNVPNTSLESPTPYPEDLFTRISQDLREIKGSFGEIRRGLNIVNLQLGIMLLAIVGGGSALLAFLVTGERSKSTNQVTLLSPQLEKLVSKVCEKKIKEINDANTKKREDAESRIDAENRRIQKCYEKLFGH